MRFRGARLIALILAVLMTLTIVVPLIVLLVGAAPIPASVSGVSNVSVRSGGNEVTRIVRNQTYDVHFDILIDLPGVIDRPVNVPPAPFTVVNDESWQPRNVNPSLSLSFPANLHPNDTASTTWRARVTVSNVRYISDWQDNWLGIAGVSLTIDSVVFDLPTIDVSISYHLFEAPPTGGNGGGGNGGGGGGWNGDDELESGTIVVESVTAHDREGNIIREVTPDTEPFSIQIIFSDLGLARVDRRDFDERSLAAFWTGSGSDELIPQGSLRGSLRTLSAPPGAPPRFSAIFNNIVYTGGTARSVRIDFRLQYSVLGEWVPGEGIAHFFGIVPDDENGDDEDDLFTPYIILTGHYFGTEQIEAGSTFTISMDFVNTSRDIDLNNIVMVISPVSTEQQPSFLTIASATNTYFFEHMPAGGSRSQSVDILVMPGASTGSQALRVDFRYEFIVDGSLRSESIDTTIYIPITQVDRFVVNPITDLSEWLQLGDEGYVVVSFINLGRATIFNVGGHILDAEGNQVQADHFGNLEAGAMGSLDFSVTPQQPGEHIGRVVIRYESEAGEEVEIETTFTMFVEEPWFRPPGGPDFEFPMFEEDPGTPWWRYALFSIGGIGIGAPISMYIIKRVKARGSEEFDEDF